jgi:hypothetical protein
MCMFSRPVRQVGKTRIFARDLGDERQLLVYGMSIDADEDLAMVLPIPTPVAPREDAVLFVDLSSSPDFFLDLDALFPAEVAAGFAPQAASRSMPQQKLVVHEVGDFQASFVPSIADLERLDERFRLPRGVWDALPQYADWSLCVFKLAQTTKPRGLVDRILGRDEPSTARRIHPMAFELPRRDPSSLFFPTVHVHDGQVHDRAWFDHTLYAQPRDEWDGLLDWERSASPAGTIASRSRTWVGRESFVYKQSLIGQLPNRDTSLTEAELRARQVVHGAFRLRMQGDWTPRLRDALVRALAPIFDAKGEAWGLAPFDDRLPSIPVVMLDIPGEFRPTTPATGCLMGFTALSASVGPKLLTVAFRSFPQKHAASQIREAFQKALDSVAL